MVSIEFFTYNGKEILIDEYSSWDFIPQLNNKIIFDDIGYNVENVIIVDKNRIRIYIDKLDHSEYNEDWEELLESNFKKSMLKELENK